MEDVNETVGETAFRRIRQEIIAGTLPPGSRLRPTCGSRVRATTGSGLGVGRGEGEALGEGLVEAEVEGEVSEGTSLGLGSPGRLHAARLSATRTAVTPPCRA